MKTKLLVLSLLLFSFSSTAQTNDWHLFTKASEITKIEPDDVNADELHLATDVGYIKFNSTTNLVTDFLNLTSQDPAIGSVKDIALDPTSNDVAMTLKDGIAIYNGSSVTNYNYTNSGLTIGEGTNQFQFLQVEYAKDGSLYIFKEDDFGYQKLNNGVFDTETVTTFKPQDIVENNAGTRVYFAGSNNGLWELEKATTTFTNYTSSNSDLIYNVLNSLYVDNSDLLHVGGFQGLNTMSGAGDWNTYQQLDPVNGVFYYPVYDISMNNTTGDLVIRTSKPNVSYFGLSLVELTTNTWTNYRMDGANCLDQNVFTASCFGGNGMVYAAPQIFSPISDIGKFIEFMPSTESCTSLDINYLNAPLALNSNVVSDFNIREKVNGNLEIGFTRSKDLHLVDLNPTTFNGVFPNATTLTPSPGDFVGSVISDNDFFLVDIDGGWVFIDDGNNMTTFSHNIPDYLAINTQKASAFNSGNGLINILHKGFDASYNYRVYKTQCDTSTSTCLASEEIFTNDRDLGQNILLSAAEDLITNEVVAVAVKTDGSGNVKRTKEKWSSVLNDASIPIWDETHPIYPILDALTVVLSLRKSISLFVEDINTIQSRSEDLNTGDSEITNTTFDENNDGNLDEIQSVNSTVITDDEAYDIAFALIAVSSQGNRGIILAAMNSNGVFDERNSSNNQRLNNLAGAEIDNNLPNDLIVQKFELTQYSPTEALMVILTNYGILVKSGVDISGLSLKIEDHSLEDSTTSLYPNPSNDMASFLNGSIGTIEVYDMNGRNVLNSVGNSISVKNLSNGIYIVKGKTSENISVNRKLIKN